MERQNRIQGIVAKWKDIGTPEFISKHEDDWLDQEVWTALPRSNPTSRVKHRTKFLAGASQRTTANTLSHQDWEVGNESLVTSRPCPFLSLLLTEKEKGRGLEGSRYVPEIGRRERGAGAIGVRADGRQCPRLHLDEPASPLSD